MSIQRERCNVVCVENGTLLCVRLEDPQSHRLYVVPPGGLIEPGETPREGAEREALEETGYRVKVDPKSEVIGRYPFHWNGQDFDCTTHFFKASLVSPKTRPVQDAPYHKGVLWVPLTQLDEHLNFHPLLYSFIKKLL